MRVFNDELAEDSLRLAGSNLWSGLLIGDYPFISEPHLSRLRYGTWHVARQIADEVQRGRADYYPLRASDVTAFVERNCGLDVVVAQVSEPDREGFCSLGVSGSYLDWALGAAPLLILHVNPAMPRSFGCRVKLSDAAFVVSERVELVEHASRPPDDVSRAIATHVASLVPHGATLQIGLGSVPESLVEMLADGDVGELAFWGMATDGIAALDAAGKLRSSHGPVVHAVDVLGTRIIFDWIHSNDRFRLVGYGTGVSPAVIGQVARFVSINSAVEIDLHGNANLEAIGAKQIGGIGGAFDFVEGARRASGGLSILALPSTTRDRKMSRIVPRLRDVPHSIPRTSVQYVVTEYGVVDLSTLSTHARAEALIGLAAPEFQNELWDWHQQAFAR